MRNIFIVTAALLIASAGPARAQDPPSIPPPTDPVKIGRSAVSGKWYGTVDFGGRATSVDGDEARFQRYRDLRPGVYATNALAGRRTADWTVEAQAWNIGYRDQRYLLDLQRVGRLTASFLWDQIPLYISADTRTLYTQTTTGVFRIEDAIQQEIQAGTKTLRNFEDQAAPFELRTLRSIGQADVVFNANPNTDLWIRFRNTTREGNIPFGATFGFNNAVELPVPIDMRTTYAQTALEWSNNRGLVRLGWEASSFDNDVDTVVWDNPLRYGPDAAGTPSQGRMGLWPGNTLTYLHGTGAVSLPARSRLTAYVALGEGRSDQALLPFTINTGIVSPVLSRPTAQAESQMTIAQLTWASRPATRLALNARYRYSDVDIQTPVFDRSTGSVAYDSTLSATAGPSEYHSVRRAAFDIDGAIAVAPFTSLKIGYSHLGAEYQHRLWEDTAENAFRVSLDTTGNQYFSLRGQYEDRRRVGEGFEPETLVEAGELLDMRHFDIADRDRRRLTLIANAMPAGSFGLNASVGIGRDEYRESGHGLQSYDSNQYSVGFNATAGDHSELSASYGWEHYRSLQRSRNANSAADQANPLRDWTTDYTGKVNFFEAGRDLNGAIDRTLIRFTADWKPVERHVSLWPGDRLTAGRARATAAGQERAAPRRG